MSSGSSHTEGNGSGLNGTAVNLLRIHEGATRELLNYPPETVFTRGEVDDDLASVFMRFAGSGIIREANDEDYDEEDVDTDGIVWTVDRDYYERALHYHGDEPTGPCKHGGVRTIEAGETYSCLNDDCDVRFDRETAEEILS